MHMGTQQSRQKIMTMQLKVPQAERLSDTVVMPLKAHLGQVTRTGSVEVI